MYIQKVKIRNVRGFKDFELVFPDNNPLAGWHVVIGDNGSGKTSLLRCVALALVGPNDVAALRQGMQDWVTVGTKENSSIQLDLFRDKDFDPFSGQGRVDEKDPVPRVNVRFQDVNQIEGPDFSRKKEMEVGISENQTLYNAPQIRLVKGANTKADRTVWGVKGGWFSVSYGPFRRFTGDQTKDLLFVTNPKLGAHLSLFDENIGLSASIKWLQDLKFKTYENVDGPEKKLLQDFIAFINQDNFLPHGTRLLNITSDGVEFEDGNKSKLLLPNLSDGYRSILSLIFELIRQVASTYNTNAVFQKSDGAIVVNFPGVVMIDEPDAHLHPTWQHRIGFWLLKHFPKMQFIVTTHSPLLCHAAVKGSVWKMPRPGSGDKFEQIKDEDLNRLLYGDVLDAYGTNLFGKGVVRSNLAEEKLKRLAELNVVALERDLTEAERKERIALRAILPTSSI